MKRLWQIVKHPSSAFLALTYVLTVLSIAGAMILLFADQSKLWVQLLSYVFYAMAAITLAYSTYTVVRFAPRIKKGILATMKRNRLLARMLESFGFRTVLFAAVSLAINIGYAAFNGVVAILSLSGWYAVLAVYYLLLILLRSGIVLYHRKKAKNASAFEDAHKRRAEEIAKYRFCGILLVIMPICLSFAILLMVSAGRGYSYMGLMIYVAASYTFYKIITSIINMVKARGSDDLTVRALRHISLADAMVSILGLQTAMFHSFGGDIDTGLANALTGGGVCALTAALGIYMLVGAHQKKKELQKEFGNGREEHEI